MTKKNENEEPKIDFEHEYNEERSKYECLLDDYADLRIKYDKQHNYCKLLEELIVTEENLLSYFRQENEELEEKLRIYKNAND